MPIRWAPNQSTSTLATVDSSWLPAKYIDISCIERSRASRYWAERAANRGPLLSSRPSDCVTRTPARLSCISALTIEMASRARAYERRELRWNHTVKTARNGSTAKAASARRTSITSSTTMIPAHPATLVRASSRPCCRRLASASTSVVMRVMIRPPISLS